jgi:hypothetical protein
MKYQTDILGKQVLPLPIKKGMISGTEADKVHAGEWLTGDKRQEYYRMVVEEAETEYDEQSLIMDWFVFAVCADHTFILKSELGYERSGIELDEFEVIKDGKEYW